MFARIDTRDIDAVFREVDRLYGSIYEDADPALMPWARDWFRTIFDGRYKDYLAIDVPYHDREHTMQGLLCLARLLRGRYDAGGEPFVDRRLFELGVIAIVLHDTGYLKHETDIEGTGAKYTLTHVDRSREFARGFLAEHGCTAEEIDAVRNMIQCTSLNVEVNGIPFSSEVERVVGCCVATADLLGQMSADDYVDRLPQLYKEFTESYEFYGEKAARLYYSSAESLLAKTPDFWRAFIMPKLENQCEGMYRYLNDPYPDGKNPYLQRIEANVDQAARRARTGSGAA